MQAIRIVVAEGVKQEMRILMLRTNRCDPDPRVEKEVNSLISRPENEVKVICWDRDGRKGKFLEKLSLPNGEVPILRFGIPASWGGGMKVNFFPMLQFEWKLFSWLLVHGNEYDTIHACDLLTGLPAWLPGKLFKKKLVYDIFDYYAATQTGPKAVLNLFARLENAIISSADAAIICSEKRREQIANSRPKRLEVLHNAPALHQINAVCQPLAAMGNRIRVVYVGNLVEDRCILKVLSCADRLPELEFHIGGFGVLEDRVRQLSSEHDNIFFYGRMQYADALDLASRGHIMLALYDPIVPNHAYAAPNKFYEALALGKPLVMFRGTGMADIVETERIGVVCDATEDGLCDAFHQLLWIRHEWDNMGKRMRQLFYDRYCWEIMERRLLDLYDGLH